jgi:subtilisin family serine protease
VQLNTRAVSSLAVDITNKQTVEQDSPMHSTSVSSYAKGQLIVKYRDSVTQCVHCLIKHGGSFQFATTDASGSLDELHQRYHVAAAKPLFRPEEKEARLGSDAFPVSRQMLEQDEQQHQEMIMRRFQIRAKRIPWDAPLPDLSHTYLLEVPDDCNIAQAVEDFSRDPHIVYAEPNYLMKVQWVPNDPYYGTSGSWGQAYDDLWGLKKIQMELAWDFTQGLGNDGQPVVVAVVDTGLDLAHEDITANVWVNTGEVPNNQLDDDGNGYVDDAQGYDFVTCDSFGMCGCVAPKSPDAIPQDGNGHGTHVAGTIAAVGNNGLGVVGVVPGAAVMPLKALNNNGEGVISELSEAIRYAADNGADVINNSWGGLGRNQTLADAVDYASALGVMVVAAAGNDYGNDALRFTPANLPRVITVAASNPADDPFDFQTGFSCRGAKLDVAAPGIDVLSLRASGTDLYGDGTHIVGSNYYRANGTSMAAPHVSGVAAALLAYRPSLTIDEVKQVLRASASDIGNSGWDILTGYGRLNAYQALITEAGPTVEITSPAMGQVLLNLSSFPLTGTAAGPGFGQYALQYRLINDLTWTQLGNPIPTPVSNGLLANWDLSVLPDGVYHLQLTATASPSGNKSYDLKEAVVIHDQSVKSGWPLRIEDFVSTNSPVIVDLDGDGVQEVVLSSISSIYVYRPNGTLLWKRSYTGAISTPSIADIHKGKALEVVFEEVGCSGVFLRVLNYDGSELWSKSVPVTNIAPSPISIGDVNLDKKMEILVPQMDDKLFVYSNTGNLIGSYFDYCNGGPVALGDLDADGTPEVIAATILPEGGRYLRKLSYDKKKRTFIESTGNWPVQVEAPTDPYGWGFSLRGPILVDLDRDGKLEIVMPTSGKLSVVRHDGTMQPGWPKTLNRIDDIGHVAAGDLDGDNEPELVLGTWASGVYIFHSDGQSIQVYPDYGDAFEPSPVIADIDGDSRGEVVINSIAWTHLGIASGLAHVYSIDYDTVTGGFNRLWTKSVTTVSGFLDNYFAAPVIGDLDRNGRTDLFVASPLYTGTHLMTWELPQAVQGTPAWPMFGHDARHTNCGSCP